MKLDSSIREARNRARHSRGDIIEAGPGEKAVIKEVLISITHLDIKYRMEWKHTNETVTVPEQSIGNSTKVGDMGRPYSWGIE